MMSVFRRLRGGLGQAAAARPVTTEVVTQAEACPTLFFSFRYALFLLRGVLAASMILAAPGDEATPKKMPQVYVPQDTEVELRILQTVSSSESQVNERVLFEVVEDVAIEDAIVIPRASKAWGLVTAVGQKSRLRKNGRIDIDLQAVCMPDGSGAALRAYRRGTQRAPGDQVSVGDSLLALPAIPFLAFIYGKDVTIPKGREFTAYLSEAMQVDRRLRRPEPAQQCPAAGEEEKQRKTPVIVQPELSSIAVRSRPEGAEIWVDDRFMGQTPATLRLLPGEHQLKLKLQDKVPWERVVATTPGGHSTIQATLESTVYVKR